VQARSARDGGANAGAGIGAGTAGADAHAVSVQTVALSALPAEAQRTARLIRSGGPFPYAKDGIVFGNRERLLPRKARGHYREYTVKTPGARDRGARRIICGGARPTEPEACYYTADHYASFARIVQ
jgi:ribonuclease T1